jgi:hypothetical protein
MRTKSCTGLRREFTSAVAAAAGREIAAECLRRFSEGESYPLGRIHYLAGAIRRIARLPNADSAIVGFAEQLATSLEPPKRKG